MLITPDITITMPSNNNLVVDGKEDDIDEVLTCSIHGDCRCGYGTFKKLCDSQILTGDAVEELRRQNSSGDFCKLMDELPNETGHTNMPTSQFYAELHPTIPRVITQAEVNKRWEMNYHEASIFLEEGKNNDKFNSHPKSQDSVPAYVIVHNRWFYCLDLAASLLLLFLAVVERPSVDTITIPLWVHGSLEIVGLLLVGIELIMKFRWLGMKNFVTHKRTMIKATTLIIQLAEAIIVLLRQTSHFRVTRALRPIFLIDNKYCGGVRRFIRQVLQSLSPIFDMLLLLFFFMTIFSILGFYLFSHNDKDPYFTTLEDSFVNLFVLLTTANFPDVMMPSYANNKITCVFFIAYLIIMLYFLMNLMLAVVYEAFTVIEKDKFRKLLLHKRSACEHAFKLLVSKGDPCSVGPKHFEGLMKYFMPKRSQRDIYLVFKTLNTSRSGALSIDEFYAIYDIGGLQWTIQKVVVPWWNSLCEPFKSVMRSAHNFVKWVWFEYFIYIVIFINGCWLLLGTAKASHDEASVQESFDISIGSSLVFVFIYALEMLLKLVVLGLKEFFLSNGWNAYDLFVTLISTAGVISGYYGYPFHFLIVLRTVRLLTVFGLKQRYRDVFNTTRVLLPRMASACVVLLILYYSFAIVGMECFSKYELRNCCKNTAVEMYYSYSNGSVFDHSYYLNNFDNIFSSFMVLFDLMLVNNWSVIMDAYAFVSTPWSRIYFMGFYLITMIVMTIVVAFILEAFLFRIQYRRLHLTGNVDGEDGRLRVQVKLNRDELEMCYRNSKTMNELTRYTRDLNAPESVTFLGMRARSKNSLCLRMYADEVNEWISSYDQSHSMSRTGTLSSFGRQTTGVSAGAILEGLESDAMFSANEDTLFDESNMRLNIACDNGIIMNESRLSADNVLA